ncbi:hypothetical protein PTNB73_09807 [Pyrenophora teres f. teres]|nr:hypothetical protein PTNB85_09142 [Pyrenophora teres f. teres]KAE8856542.1 hypothetical protein PTNB73_09807 [Pyrenophora teres f. teres]
MPRLTKTDRTTARGICGLADEQHLGPVVRRTRSIPDMDASPASRAEPPPTQDAQAVEPPSLKRINSGEAERPPSAQRTQDGDDANDAADSKSEADSDDGESDPADRITDFDWEDLHHRYHEAMKTCHGEEAALMHEWEALMNYFRVWAQSGHEHETDRTYSRLRTRTTFVQHEEDTLEQKRHHYINVVKAFESALSLLKNNGFRG